MPYWGSKPIDCDYAFDAIGAYVFLIKDRMFKDMTVVRDKSHPEQGIIASLQCIRVIAEQFPKCVRPHFRKREFEQSKAAFSEWYELVKDKLPSEHRDLIRIEAEAEFSLFEKRVLS